MQANSKLVVCPDGTMLDFKTGRVVLDPHKNARAGEWGPTKTISPPRITGSWNDRSAADLSNNMQAPLSRELDAADSAKYWSEVESKEHAECGEMSDAQKKLLADLEAGHIMKLSRLELVDES